MTGFYLGIDIGGTKSHALIADGTGHAVGFGMGGPGNHEVVGYDGLATTLQHLTHQAMRSAGLRHDDITAVGIGVAGYDWPSELQPTLGAIDSVGLQVPKLVVNDTIIGLVAGAEAGWGVAVVAGTSNNCWGWDSQRRIGRVMGDGYLYGENGGAHELVIRAIQAVAKEWTCRGPATALTLAFMELVGASSVADLLEGLSQDYYDLGPEAAPLVIDVAQAGDQVALDVVRWAGRELGSLAVGVIRQLDFANLSFELVLVGSMFNAGHLLLEPMQETVFAVAPGARFVRLTAPPVVGAVLLAMEQVGVDGRQTRRRLLVSTRGSFGVEAATR